MKLEPQRNPYDTTLSYQIAPIRKDKKLSRLLEENYYYADPSRDNSLGDVVVFKSPYAKNLTFVLLGSDFNILVSETHENHIIVGMNLRMRRWLKTTVPRIALTNNFFVLRKRNGKFYDYSIVRQCIFLNKQVFIEKIKEIYDIEIHPTSYVRIMNACTCCENQKAPKGVQLGLEENFKKKSIERISKVRLLG